jgi:hypothetical protein
MALKVGDVIQENLKYDSLTVVAVVLEEPDENGIFEAWTVSVSRHDGRLMSFSRGTYQESDVVRRIPAPSGSGLRQLTSLRYLDHQVAEADAAVDRALAKQEGPQ